jgi:hypothetical protein
LPPEIPVSNEFPEFPVSKISDMPVIEHAGNKHMEVKYYYVRDCIAENKVRIFKILTTYQCADILIKPLGKQIFDRLVPSAMGHIDPILTENKPKTDEK